MRQQMNEQVGDSRVTITLSKPKIWLIRDHLCSCNTCIRASINMRAYQLHAWMVWGSFLTLHLICQIYSTNGHPDQLAAMAADGQQYSFLILSPLLSSVRPAVISSVVILFKVSMQCRFNLHAPIQPELQSRNAKAGQCIPFSFKKTRKALQSALQQEAISN